MVTKPLNIFLFFCFWLFSAGEVLGMMDTMIAPCASGDYISIDSLYEYCKTVENCGKKIACEDQSVLIMGYIDYGNVFDKTNYPSLPYQKFLMTNSDRSQSIEVWVDCECSEAVFDRLFRQQTLDSGQVAYVRGTLAGFDMPVMGHCHRGFKINLIDGNSLSFNADCN